jgi:hypothetical protein
MKLESMESVFRVTKEDKKWFLKIYILFTVI